MAVRKPITIVGGQMQQITAPDTIDPTILPAASGGGAPIKVAAAATFTVADNSQIPYGTQIFVQAGGQIKILGTGRLQWKS